jgi:hypothetical protein
MVKTPNKTRTKNHTKSATKDCPVEFLDGIDTSIWVLNQLIQLEGND